MNDQPPHHASHCKSFCAGFAFLLKMPPPEGFRWPSIYHFMEATAKLMPPAVLASKLGRMKQCYMNSANTTLRHNEDRYVYCEGMAIPDGVPIPLNHAWLLDPETGSVIETTWKEPGLEYFGIAFTRVYLRKALLARKCYGLIDAPELDFPLLRMTAEELTTVLHPSMNNL